MANFNPGTGKWEASSGGQFDSRHEAQMRENINRDSSSGNNEFFDGMLRVMWMLFCLIPKFCGLAVGGLCGLILKLGMVGKVVLSLLAAAGALIILSVAVNEISFLNTDNTVVSTVVGIVTLILALAVGAWFWIWHYKVVKQMPYVDFVALTTRCMMICFWGPISIAVFFLLLRLFGVVDKSPIGFAAGVGISLAVAIGYWIMNVNTYKSSDIGSSNSGTRQPDSLPAPTPLPSADARCSAGDLVWSRWSQDGNLYFAGIAGSSQAGVKVVYYDGVQEEVPGKDIFYLSEAQQSGLTPYGNWENKGSFYPCEILELRQNSVLVRYTQDNVKEELPYPGLVFMN